MVFFMQTIGSGIMNLQTESNLMTKFDTSSYLKLQTLTKEQPLERNSPPSLSLDTGGFIAQFGKSIEELFGYTQQQLMWRHICCLFPKFSEVDLMQSGRLNPLLSYLCHCDHEFDAIDRHGKIVTCNLNFFLIEQNGMPSIRLIVRPVGNPKADMSKDLKLHHEEPAGGFPVLSKE
jgi:PAS domain S-box-containing protein